MILRRIKHILLRSDAFIEFRYSPPILRLLLFLRPSVKAKLKAQKEFYSGFLRNLKWGTHVAFDIGANEGFITEIFLKKQLSVVAVEPDPRNIAILTRRFGENEKFHLLPYAAASNSGTGEFYLQKKGTAFSTVNPKWKQLIEKGKYRFHHSYNEVPLNVQLITVDVLIQVYGSPSFIKIDVEGYETEVMKGLSHKIPIIIFEANLPEFIVETQECIDRLHEIDNEVVFNYSVSFKTAQKKFLGYSEFKRELAQIREPSIDIISIMSNYAEFYEQYPPNY